MAGVGSYNLQQTNQPLCTGHSTKALKSQSSLKHPANGTEHDKDVFLIRILAFTVFLSTVLMCL